MKSYFTKLVSSNMSKTRGGRPDSGFTLIELMIVVVIIAILAGIAYPAYQKQVLQSRRSDAKAALQQLAAREEQFYMDNKTYTTVLTQMAYTATPTVTTADGYYTIRVVAATATCPITTCYLLQAAPTAKGGQNSDACGNLTLSSTGVRSPTSGCW